MKVGRRGFTIVEVLVAIVMLSIGVLALSSSSGTVSRMVYRARVKGESAAIGQSILDSLRAKAQQSGCSSLANGSTTPQTGLSAAWTVTASTNVRNVVVVNTYRVGGGRTMTDTLQTILYCP